MTSGEVSTDGEQSISDHLRRFLQLVFPTVCALRDDTRKNHFDPTAAALDDLAAMKLPNVKVVEVGA